jgi:hypothetical protein
MNNYEKEMVNLLIDLRKNYGAVGIKTEFEGEGVRLEEFQRLKEITMLAELPITLKIGGGEALTDMYFGKTIGISHLVAPMIESAFAVKKFMFAVKKAYSIDEFEDLVPEINVETITGYNNFPEIVALPEYEKLGGVIIGRVDMAGSMGLGYDDVDSDAVFSICYNIFRDSKKKFPNKLCTLGGITSFRVLNFLKKFPAEIVDRYEQRKVIFALKNYQDDQIKESIMKGLQFERMWYENKSQHYSRISEEDKQYLKLLQANYKQMQGQL